MSYSPNALGAYDPTSQVRPRRTPSARRLYGANPLMFARADDSESPNAVAVVEQARQAYSHSASVGKRYVHPRSASSGSRPSPSQKSLMSPQSTFSTGKLLVSSPATVLASSPSA